jgi:hypothetical protein
MENKVIFRDNQEVQSADFINQQDWAQEALDHVILDTIEDGQAYSGFRITKKAQTVVSFTPGRLYNGGAVYARDENVDIDLFNALPIVTQRRVAIVAWGQALNEDNQPRDFLVDAATGRTQPQTVPMQNTRHCELSPVNGVEAPDPSYPTTDINVTVVAYALLDPTGVIAIEQFPDTQVENLRGVSDRTELLESWRGVIGALVDTLKTDIGNLAARLSNFVLFTDFQKLADKVSALWEKAFNPGTYIFYGQDYFLDSAGSATTASGYDCRIEEGLRFAPNGQVTTQLGLLNPNDQSISLNGGFAIPAYTSVLRIDAPGYDFEERFLQWVFRHPYAARRLFRIRRRHRCGRLWLPCPDAQVWWYQAQRDPTTRILSFAAEVWETVEWGIIAQHNEGGCDWPRHRWTRGIYHWVDEVVERYWSKVNVGYSLSGQHLSQCFFNSQDGWLTQIGLHFTRLAAAGDVIVLVCQTNLGCPADDRIICRVDVSRAQLKAGAPSSGHGLPGLVETQIPIPPTFLEAGQTYSIVVLCPWDHYHAMCANAMQVLQGNFFHSGDDGHVFDTRGRLMKIRLYYAKFAATRVEVPLQPLQLAGGITSVEVLAEHIIPPACEVDFEVQIAGVWSAFAEGENSPDFSTNPALLPFRMVMRGTPDLMPGVSIAPSEVYLATHKNTFRHISSEILLGTPTTHVKVLIQMDGFVAANHTCSCHLTDTGGADEAADVVGDVTLPSGSIQRTFTFNTASISKFQVVVDGTTNGSGDLFHVSQEIRWAT